MTTATDWDIRDMSWSPSAAGEGVTAGLGLAAGADVLGTAPAPLTGVGARSVDGNTVVCNDDNLLVHEAEGGVGVLTDDDD